MLLLCFLLAFPRWRSSRYIPIIRRHLPLRARTHPIPCRPSRLTSRNIPPSSHPLSNRISRNRRTRHRRSLHLTHRAASKAEATVRIESGQPSGQSTYPQQQNVSAAKRPGLPVIGQFSQLGAAGHGGTRAHGSLPHRFHVRPLDVATGERPLGGSKRSCAGRRNQPARRHLRAQLSLRSAGHVLTRGCSMPSGANTRRWAGSIWSRHTPPRMAARPTCGSASTTCARPGRSCSSRALRNLNLIAFSGNLSPLDLLHLRGHFGIPRFPGDRFSPSPGAAARVAPARVNKPRFDTRMTKSPGNGHLLDNDAWLRV